MIFSLLPDMAKNKKTKVVICPPFIWLAGLIRQYKKSVSFGAQNVFWKEAGAFTGEISAAMLKSAGAEYVIIGHSERKIYLGETDELVNKKIKAALKVGLKPIICIGEKERGEDSEVPGIVGEQIKKALDGIHKNQLKKIILAYEPIWAISTMPGARPDTPDNAFRVSIFIRKILTQLHGRKAVEAVKIIYGGSVNSANVAAFIREGKMEGVLVGSASLDPAEFVKIMEAAGN